jgi:signal transduction histidine kinase
MSEANQFEPAPPQQIRGLPLGDLLALGLQIRADITPDMLLHEAAEAVRRVIASPLVYVRLRNTDTDELIAVAFAGANPELEQTLRGTSIPPGTYQTLLRNEAASNAPFVLLPGVTVEPQLPAEQFKNARILLIAMRGRSDRLIGVFFAVLAEHAATLDSTEIVVVETLVRQAALALENVRLAERSARLLAKEQLLVDLGRDVSATLDLDTILARTVARLEAAFTSGSITLLNEASELQLRATTAADQPLLAHFEQPAPSLLATMASWVVAHSRPLVVSDVRHDERFADEQNDEQVAQNDYLSWIIVPLRSGGQIIGTLNVGSPATDAFTFDEVDLLEAIAAQVGGPITSARLYERSQRLAAQVQRRADQLMVLNGVARTATTALDQEAVLPQIAAQVQQGFGYSQVDFFLLDEETNELVLAAAAGMYPFISGGYRQHMNLGLLGRAVRSGEPVLVDDVLQDPEYLQLAERSATRAELVTPIKLSGRVLGLLNIEAPVPASFGPEDFSILETVADVLAGALENFRLYRKAQSAAALEERNRLARELHDSVTQQLFSMTLTAQAARAHLEKNPQRAAVQLERLQETATAALAEMRALIFQLRPPALRDQGLIAALQQHAALLSRREGLRIELSVSGDERLARGVEQPLFRIVQESLNNVIKHAKATSVSVNIEFTNERLRVRVADDGQGFDPSGPPSLGGRHLGVIGMRERAAEIGGSMEIHSVPGGGTEVIVTVPRQSS